MFSVHPKLDCPHHHDLNVSRLCSALTAEKINSPCSLCKGVENWFCLTCESIFCSRYEQGHMSTHFEEVGHAVALSFSDGSFWCYECDSYVYSPVLQQLARHFSDTKFPDGDQMDRLFGSQQVDAATAVEEEVAKASPVQAFDKQQLVHGIASEKFKRIAVLTGAGISVAAGIPDFRSAGTGLYARVADWGLSKPEDVFHIEVFKEDPTHFYHVAKMFFNDFSVEPVKAHKFIKTLNDRGQLMMNYTQNIDGLELKAGLPLDKLVQAHGHMRNARCYQCKKEYEIEMFRKYVEDDKILYCDSCQGGIVKPDIVFFGEKLSESFAMHFQSIDEADLIIAMGSSFKVFPFAFLLHMLPRATPIVMINREDPGVLNGRENFLFLQGDIEDHIDELCQDLCWNL